MDLRIFTEPQQGASYQDVLAVAQATEALGFDAFFRSDHYLAMGEASGLPGPTDAWTTLAGLARETSRIKLGTLVTAATFRHPGILAIQVAQVDAMSGGRVELGLGAGWFAREHEAYGIPFPAKRFGLLTEQFEILTGLWGTPEGELFSHDGENYRLVDSPALGKPLQKQIDGRPGVPLIVGGHGPRRTPALAARFAAEFNLAFPAKDEITAKFARVREAAEAIERNPDDLTYSAAMVLCAGATEADVVRRAAAIGRQADELRANGVAGTVPEVIDTLGRLKESGVERVYLQVLDLADLDHLDLVAREVMPNVA